MNTQVVLSTKPLRQKSPIIASYPWQTSVLDSADFVDIFRETSFKVWFDLTHFLVNVFNIMGQNFSEKVLAFESMIASASHGDAFDLRLFLGFEREYTHLDHLQQPAQGKGLDRITTLSSKNKNALANLLVAYRMVDIAASLESQSELPIRYEKNTDVEGDIPVGTLSFLGNGIFSLFFSFSNGCKTGYLFYLTSLTLAAPAVSRPTSAPMQRFYIADI